MDDLSFGLNLEIKYLSNTICDKIKKYIESTENLLEFNGSLTPHGYYDIRISPSEEKETSKIKLKKHYHNLLDIILDRE